MRRRCFDRDPVVVFALAGMFALVLIAPAAAWRLLDGTARIVPQAERATTRDVVCAIPAAPAMPSETTETWYEETEVSDADLGAWLLSDDPGDDGAPRAHCWLGN